MTDLIEELKQILKFPDPSRFKDIADILMNKCCISKNDKKYEIVEIEFYLFTPDHQDVITYPRKISAGQWFFHPSGVDLTFESNHEHFGGILIRGIKRLSPRVEGDKCQLLIMGPQKCIDELWDNFDAFNNDKVEYPHISEARIECFGQFDSYPRWIPVNKSKGEDEAKNDRVKAAIERNKKFVSDNPYLGLLGTYDQIDKSQAIDIMFKQRYRFIKSSIMKDPAWKAYSAKPKS